MVWPHAHSGEGGYDVVLPAMLDANAQDMHTLWSLGLRHGLPSVKLLVNPWKISGETCSSCRTGEWLLPGCTGPTGCLGPPFNAFKSKWSEIPSRSSSLCTSMLSDKIHDFQREYLQAKKISKGWDHERGNSNFWGPIKSKLKGVPWATWCINTRLQASDEKRRQCGSSCLHPSLIIPSKLPNSWAQNSNHYRENQCYRRSKAYRLARLIPALKNIEKNIAQPSFFLLS